MVGSATSGSNRIVCTTVSVVRSTHTSLGPPGFVFVNFGLPVSRIQSRSSGSTTMLCTDTRASASRLPWASFHSASGYGTTVPSTISPTVASTSSPHFGKLTKIRPVWETLIPVGMGPSVNRWTTSSSPTGSSVIAAVLVVLLPVLAVTVVPPGGTG